MNNNTLLKSPRTVFEPHIFCDQELPFIMHHNVMTKSQFPNIHENPEFIYITKGTGYILYDGQRHPIKEGDTVLISSYAEHQVISEKDLCYFYLIVDTYFCRYNSIEVTTLLFEPLVTDADLAECFKRIMQAGDDSTAWHKATLKSAILELLLLVCCRYSRPRKEPLNINGTSLRYMCNAIEYIKNHFNERITADAVANYVGLSKYHFLREFKKNTGYTLTTYINIVRIERARIMLQSGQYSVKEAAQLCGFENDSYFSNVFRHYSGVLPSEVLKKSKK